MKSLFVLKKSNWLYGKPRLRFQKILGLPSNSVFQIKSLDLFKLFIISTKDLFGKFRGSFYLRHQGVLFSKERAEKIKINKFHEKSISLLKNSSFKSLFNFAPANFKIFPLLIMTSQFHTIRNFYLILLIFISPLYPLSPFFS